MDVVAATPDAIRRYGDASAAMATTVATVGAVDQGATMAAAVPVFGLIGQDFLFSFAGAQANHLSSVAELAAVHAGTALTAYEGAATYQSTDDASATEVGATMHDER
ncbi:type VII secretion target [Nocardia pseudobrasiliensis]|uniref:Excreted virulence factor EspC (Type VII ESX diderm) n=1 Tax=Nocardia pseudobrasiliensis TaxID=45979 RepID=A0A370I5C2_9NOCA|nr:type VII secretion target [Nocardia pseudobrasiliensis]RDI64514.1 excreted virulence factor EspC (type VII ESX diderm) [Nocardia pseudobrasiliensis]